MKTEYTPENSGLIFHANIFFLAIAGWWFYGIYTTFFKGSIPIFGWTTNHNIILGILWIIVLGQGAPMPVKAFRQICGLIAVWRRGYLYLPVFLASLLIQLYFWVIVITVWFPQPLPSPFQNVDGGFVIGLIALVIMIPVCAATNVIAFRLLRSFTQKDPR
jgi:hypothetical protein